VILPGQRPYHLSAFIRTNIPDDFPDDVIAEADTAQPEGLKGREDLRDVPLITIDPSDARDHDDACFAEADTDPSNKGGHILWVAIADVSAYVTPGSALAREARKRGNATYFPVRGRPIVSGPLVWRSLLASRRCWDVPAPPGGWC